MLSETQCSPYNLCVISTSARRSCMTCRAAVRRIMFPSLWFVLSTPHLVQGLLSASSTRTSSWRSSALTQALISQHSKHWPKASRSRSACWVMESGEAGAEERSKMVQEALQAVKEFNEKEAMKTKEQGSEMDRMKIVEKVAHQLHVDGAELAKWDEKTSTQDAIDKVAESVAEMFLREQADKDGGTAGSLGEDITKFFGHTMGKQQAALIADKEEMLRTQLNTSDTAENAAREVSEQIQSELDKTDTRIKELLEPAKAKVEAEKANLEKAMLRAKDARAAYNRDFFVQLSSFPKKGIQRQMAFVAAVLISNQAVYQAILTADDRGGSPIFAVGGLVVSAVLLWFYGYRPFA